MEKHGFQIWHFDCNCSYSRQLSSCMENVVGDIVIGLKSLRPMEFWISQISFKIK